MAGVELTTFNWKLNGLGWMDISTGFYNASEKTIKYITFSYVAYNRVGDVVSCTVKKQSIVKGKITGPLEVNKDSWVEFENMLCNNTISEIKIKEVVVQYMDNSIETIAGADLKCIYNSQGLNKDTVYYEKRGKAEEETKRKREEESKKREEESKKREEEYKKREEEERKKREEEKKKEAAEDKKKFTITGIIFGVFCVLAAVLGSTGSCG